MDAREALNAFHHLSLSALRCLEGNELSLCSSQKAWFTRPLVARMGEDGRGHPEVLLADGDCTAITSSKETSETQMEIHENSTHCI